jgi:short-subunit dehydrogenase
MKFGAAHAIQRASRSCRTCAECDSTCPILGSIDDSFNAALAEAGHFDVLINNAGSGHFGPAENLSAEAIANQFQVLVFGHLQLMTLTLPAMRSHGHGLIINVTSLASRLPVPFMAAYNAANAAMAAFTMSIQLELPDSRVRIVDLRGAF